MRCLGCSTYLCGTAVIEAAALPHAYMLDFEYQRVLL
jgi:hypothetical protein